MTDVALTLTVEFPPPRLIAVSKDKSAATHSARLASIELATSFFTAFATAACYFFYSFALSSLSPSPPPDLLELSPPPSAFLFLASCLAFN